MHLVLLRTLRYRGISVRTGYVCLILALASVESAAQAPRSWRLAQQPAFSIGQRDGDSPAAFGNVVGVAEIGAGVVVADGQAMALKFFDRAGRSTSVSGRVGGGPGEYRTIKSIHRCGADSLFVYDPGAMRLSVLSSKGTYLRAIDVRSLSASGAPPYEIACNPNGVFAYTHRAPMPPSGVGPRRPSVAITLSSRDGGDVTLGTFPASERYFDGSNDFPRPFGKVTSVAVGTEIVVIGTGEGDSLLVVSLRDRARRVVRIIRPVRRLTSEHISEFVADQLARRVGRADTASLRQFYSALEYPATLPPYRRIILDAADRLWVEDYALPGAKTVRWTILDREGRVLATLSCPSNFEFAEVGMNSVRGVWRDELGVQWIREYDIER